MNWQFGKEQILRDVEKRRRELIADNHPLDPFTPSNIYIYTLLSELYGCRFSDFNGSKLISLHVSPLRFLPSRVVT